MQSMKGRIRVAVVTSFVAMWGALAYACSSGEENPGNPTRKTADSGADGSIDPTGNNDASLGAPICGKYGGYENVKSIAGAILERVKGDCRISAPIAGLNADEQQHLTECFEIMVGGAFQCQGISYVANTTTDSKNRKCRDMTAAHKGLNLRNGDFNAFLEDIAAELGAKGLSQEDIRAIAPAFEGTRAGVVQNGNQPNANTFCTCPNGEYNGKSCVPEGGIIDAGQDQDSGPTDAASDG